MYTLLIGVILLIILILLWINYGRYNKEQYDINNDLVNGVNDYMCKYKGNKCAAGTRIGRYLYYPYMGYDGFTLEKRLDLFNNHADLMARCESLPTCVGFDSGGRLYSTYIPRAAWYAQFPSATQGLFMKDYQYNSIS
jgi:hypothetical protein